MKGRTERDGGRTEEEEHMNGMYQCHLSLNVEGRWPVMMWHDTSCAN